MIHLENIHKTYNLGTPNALHVLKGIDLHINKGELVSIMGSSGSGKSTLLNILGILDNYDEGAYYLDGHLIKDLSETQGARLRNELIGFVFQSFNLIDELNVTENVELPLLYMGTSKKERRQQVKDVIERVAMAHRAQHFPAQLSGGQQQRVAIARAVISHPQIILADEPTGNLDSKHGMEVMDLLKQLHEEGTTIIMVTHSQRDANYADRIVNLFDGEIVSELKM